MIQFIAYHGLDSKCLSGPRLSYIYSYATDCIYIYMSSFRFTNFKNQLYCLLFSTNFEHIKDGICISCCAAKRILICSFLWESLRRISRWLISHILDHCYDIRSLLRNKLLHDVDKSRKSSHIVREEWIVKNII